MIRGLRREVDTNCVLLGYYANMRPIGCREEITATFCVITQNSVVLKSRFL